MEGLSSIVLSRGLYIGLEVNTVVFTVFFSWGLCRFRIFYLLIYSEVVIRIFWYFSYGIKVIVK